MSNYLLHLTRSSTTNTGALPFAVFHYYIHRRFASQKTHYDALGISSNATAKEIKTAFYKLSKKHHPDVNPEDASASQKFTTISNAYDVLSDPIKRRDYDHEVFSRTGSNDPYITYDRTSAYAQRARAHRPSAWKPPPSSSSNGGFQGSENAFGSSRNTSYGTFDREQYDAAFGRYRGPTPSGRSNIYDFDEFYRAHYADFQNWSTNRKKAQAKMRQDQQDAEMKRQMTANRSLLTKVSLAVLWLFLGLVVLFVSTKLHDMHFQKPIDEFQAQFYIVSKTKPTKKQQD